MRNRCATDAQPRQQARHRAWPDHTPIMFAHLSAARASYRPGARGSCHPGSNSPVRRQQASTSSSRAFQTACMGPWERSSSVFKAFCMHNSGKRSVASNSQVPEPNSESPEDVRASHGDVENAFQDANWTGGWVGWAC
eukprot:18993-Chlamydomonas_euryale.AAC.1